MATANGVYHPVDGNPYVLTGEDAGEGDLGKLAATAGQYAQDVAQQAKDEANEYTDNTVSPVRDFVTLPPPPDEISTIPHPSYAVPVMDAAGYIAGGWLQDGTHNTEKAPRVMGATGVTAQPVQAPGWAFVYADAEGRVAYGVRTDGTFVAHKGATADLDPAAIGSAIIGLTRSKRDAVIAVGDSLTAGHYEGSGNQYQDSYPAKLAEMLPGVTVTNAAQSGMTVDEEAIRMGAFPLPLTVTGGSIPASGPVGVTTPAVIGWRNPDAVRTFPGSLAGVPGDLSRAADGSLTFTRGTPGSAVAVPAGTQWSTPYDDHHADTMLVMLGRNNVGQSATVPGKTVAEHVVDGIARIVDWHSRGLAQVLVLSVTTRTDETEGTGGHATVVAINDALSATYGPRYFDLRRYLVDQAIYDLGLTPTPEDLDAMDGDTLPPSIMDDSTHYTRETAELVAAQVHDYLTTRDWTLT